MTFDLLTLKLSVTSLGCIPASTSSTVSSLKEGRQLRLFGWPISIYYIIYSITQTEVLNRFDCLHLLGLLNATFRNVNYSYTVPGTLLQTVIIALKKCKVK